MDIFNKCFCFSSTICFYRFSFNFCNIINCSSYTIILDAQNIAVVIDMKRKKRIKINVPAWTLVENYFIRLSIKHIIYQRCSFEESSKELLSRKPRDSLLFILELMRF